MKKVNSILALFFLLPLISFPQSAVRDYGNNHISTTSISFTSDGRYMLIGGYPKIFDVISGVLVKRLIEEEDIAMGDIAYLVGISPNDQLFFATKLNRLEVWNLQSRTLIKTIRDGKIAVKAACFSRDSRYIIYMRSNGEIVFLNSASLTESHKQKITGETPTVLTPSPDGKKLFIGTRSNTVFVYDLNSRNISSFVIDCKAVYNIDIPPSGNYIAASTFDGKIWLGKYPSLEPVRSWQAHSADYTAIAFHPSGEYLASGGKDKAIHIWKIPECTIQNTWENAHKLALLSLAFSPDGTTLASGSQNEVRIGGGDDTKTRSFSAPSKLTAAVTSKNEASPPKVNPPATSEVTSTAPSAQKRLALVIGNGSYTGSFLANPENDARAMKNVLVQYGFDVLEYENLTQAQMKKAMDEFGNRLKNYDVGLFFYAGHGIQAKGYNYLIPVDADLKSEEQVEYDCVQADRILALMEASGTDVNIIILDACRNNPFERSWTRSSSGKGLAFMNAPKGSLIAYATAPGSTASDGSGNNGLYTSALLESIKIPKINILQVFQNVRVIVSDKSEGRQVPWESTSLTGDFIF
jgi:WD40 repeat protein